MNIERFTNSEGFVYVLAFANGIVKVGKTTNPHTRIAEHGRDAARFGATINATWVSAPHIGYHANERSLIAFCESRWTRSGGIEYFADADFKAVAEYAAALPFGRGKGQDGSTPGEEPRSCMNDNITERNETAWKVWTGFRMDSLPSRLQPLLGANWHSKFTSALAELESARSEPIDADDVAILARQVFARMSRSEYEDALNHLVIDYWLGLREEANEDFLRRELDAIGRAALERGAP